jgi:hypothetical protein
MMSSCSRVDERLIRSRRSPSRAHGCWLSPRSVLAHCWLSANPAKSRLALKRFHPSGGWRALLSRDRGGSVAAVEATLAGETRHLDAHESSASLLAKDVKPASLRSVFEQPCRLPTARSAPSRGSEPRGPRAHANHARL